MMMTDLHETLDTVLREVVIGITGEDLGPRPGQKALAHDIMTAMQNNGRVSGVGPTGLGKSVSLLAPAMVMAAVCDERTVLSTESLALQAQILDKDAPDVADAVEKVTGVRPTFAVHKGFSNHACFLAAHTSAKEVVKQRTKKELATPEVNTVLSEFTQQAIARDAIAEAHEALQNLGPSRKRAKVGDQTFEPTPYVELLKWATSSTDEGAGNKSKFEGELPYGSWGTVSMTPQECPGAKGCPFASVCLPRAARTKARQSDIVVTNHSLLGIQAASAAPVILGSRALGNFQHIMVDEAHGLPGIVRNGGAVDVTARRVGSAVAAMNSIVDVNRDDKARGLIDHGNDVTNRLERALNRVKGLTEASPVELTDDMDSQLEAIADVKSWCQAAAAIIPEPPKGDTSAFLRLIRVKSRLERLAEDASVAAADSTIPIAKWFESTPSGPAFKASPVDVAPHIAANLFSAKLVPDATLDEEDCLDPETGAPMVVPLSVSMVSATLPTSFRRDSGIGVPTKEYPSPFDSAYGDSMCFSPKLDGDDLEAVADRAGYRWKFNTDKHASWATERIIELVVANGGSALVLSANKKNGERYAEALRRRTKLQVYSQWDGRDPRLIVGDWRHDTASVMVGTRSLMTGVDAKGDTCSLVVIDRVPRAMGNVVDDARVKAIMESLDIDRWAADKFVYVSDASLLLEQAFGRLIRTMSDSGLAVCLDPRIVPGSPLSYRRDVADIYLNAMRRFTVRRSSMDSAMAFLKGRNS